MSSARRQARVLAMQALCQQDVQASLTDEELNAWLTDQEAPPSAVGYAGELVRAARTLREQGDRWIAAAAEHWDLERMSPVERNVMRVALVEMVGETVPPKVAINEAIEIAREYGGADSPRFVNGLLDSVLKRIRQDTT